MKLPLHTVCLFLFLTGLLGVSATRLEAYSLYLKGKHVFGSELRLGDLGRISGANDPKTLSSKLVVRNLKRPVYLKATRLKELLKNATPEKIDKIYGSGIWLVPEDRLLGAKELEKLLFLQIARLPGSDTLQKKMQIRVAAGSQIQVPSEGVELRFRLPAHARSLTPGKRILALDLLVPSASSETKGASSFLLRKRVSIEIRRWVEVAVARHDLAVGHTITQKDFHLEKRAVFGSRRDYELPRPLQSLKAVRKIRAGEDLTIRNVQRLPAVRRGQSVKLVYQSTGLVLRISSVALRDAETGESLKVRVVLPGGRYGKTLTARVADTGVVVAE